MRNKILLLACGLFLLSCGKENKRKGAKVSFRTDSISFRTDSIKTYKKIRERKEKKKEVIKFLDSLQEYDAERYNLLFEELQDRDFKENKESYFY